MSADANILGKGFLKKPYKLPFYEGDKYDNLILRYLGKDNVDWEYTFRYKNNEFGRVVGIRVQNPNKFIDPSQFNIPDKILASIEQSDLKAKNLDKPPFLNPTGDCGYYKNDFKESLCNRDYYIHSNGNTSTSSGWVCSLNNSINTNYMKDLGPSDTQVFRLQFNFDNSQMPLCEENKGDLLSEVADINSSQDKDKLFKDQHFQEAYDKANDVLANAESTKDEISDALNDLKNARDNAKKDLGNVLTTPVISTQPQGGDEYYKGDKANPINVVAGDVGENELLTYQWYENDVNSNQNGTRIEGEIGSSYTPSTDTVGQKYYYVEITNTNLISNNTDKVVSDVVGIKVRKALTPVITTQPQSAEYYKEDNATSLNVAVEDVANDEGISYQWYENDVDSNENGTKIENEKNSSYTPSTDTVEQKYYYVEITNTNTSKNRKETIASDVARIKVKRHTPSGGGSSSESGSEGGSSSENASGGSGSSTTESSIDTSKTLAGADRYETAVKISQDGWNKSDNVIIASGDAYADALVASPFSTKQNAPVLLTRQGDIPNVTFAEIKRLSAKNITIIGGENVVSSEVVKDLEKSGLKVNRIAGKDRFETSLKVAKALYGDKSIDKIYIAGGYAPADAVSISARAGIENTPIIFVGKDNIDKATEDFIKAKKVNSAYIIGGTDVVSDSVKDALNKVTTSDISKNRIAGKDRYETNASIIKNLYQNNSNTNSSNSNNMDTIYVTESEKLIDSLVISPLAAKKNAPVVLTSSELKDSQKDMFNQGNIKSIVRVGGQVKEKVVKSIVELLTK
ncbi:MAG: cell wall-binding repeat-containing protein [Clostridioides sp.]|jgi:putative cell wall-binding protein|nr:cell wall-binding repeat-containing protein [Clostridioides sp.]